MSVTNSGLVVASAAGNSPHRAFENAVALGELLADSCTALAVRVAWLVQAANFFYVGWCQFRPGMRGAVQVSCPSPTFRYPIRDVPSMGCQKQMTRADTRGYVAVVADDSFRWNRPMDVLVDEAVSTLRPSRSASAELAIAPAFEQRSGPQPTTGRDIHARYVRGRQSVREGLHLHAHHCIRDD